MILIDRPYISDFLKRTIEENGLAVADTPEARAMGFDGETFMVPEEEAVKRLRASEHPAFYTPSEEALRWIARSASGSPYAERIDRFKDKVRFRDMLRNLYPDFVYREVPIGDLDALDIRDLPFPLVMKPASGFFSIGVYRIERPEDWRPALDAFGAEMARAGGVYPEEVLRTTSVILEECIEGDEFAVDAYFDAEGEPVILNILEHPYASASDVSDRVYVSSKRIIEKNLQPFTHFLAEVGRLSGVRNFPLHTELRRRPDGILMPIEINPLRFGGWCTTADMTFHAYGFNAYLFFQEQRRPDWDSILQAREGRIYSIIVLNNSTGVPLDAIASFDYERLAARFEKIFELRKVDHKRYLIFGFLFAETREKNRGELEWILNSNLREFVTFEEGGTGGAS